MGVGKHLNRYTAFPYSPHLSLNRYTPFPYCPYLSLNISKRFANFRNVSTPFKMDANTRSEYGQISASQWEQLGYTTRTAYPDDSPLTHAIHPSFYKRNEQRVEGNKSIWFYEGRI